MVWAVIGGVPRCYSQLEGCLKRSPPGEYVTVVGAYVTQLLDDAAMARDDFLRAHPEATVFLKTLASQDLPCGIKTVTNVFKPKTCSLYKPSTPAMAFVLSVSKLIELTKDTFPFKSIFYQKNSFHGV